MRAPYVLPKNCFPEITVSSVGRRSTSAEVVREARKLGTWGYRWRHRC
jgi:hypothetical protein